MILLIYTGEDALMSTTYDTFDILHGHAIIHKVEILSGLFFHTLPSRKCSFWTNLILCADDGMPLLRTDTDILATGNEINCKTGAQPAGSSKHCDERIGGWICQPCFAKAIVLICTLVGIKEFQKLNLRSSDRVCLCQIVIQVN